MSVPLIVAVLFCCWPCSVSVYSWPVPACPPCQSGHVCSLAHTYRQHCPFNVIIADPHCLLSPGLTWTSASSEEGNVRYPQASVTPLHSADPKKSKFVLKKKKNAFTLQSPLLLVHRRRKKQNKTKTPKRDVFVPPQLISLWQLRFLPLC